MTRYSFYCVALLGVALGCSSQHRPNEKLSVTMAESSPPLDLQGAAFDAAGSVTLPEVQPVDHESLHNVYVLSDSIISGAEPGNPEALELLASWGVKTILSVDGKVPDAETAEELGMRYVHVPIQYKGIREDELLKIAKTFRELEGPFYVHCFHGKHRGPAAAAVGRVVLDEVPRVRAMAEMRQWCATSSKYEGLYSAIANTEIPSRAETATYDFDFAPAHSFEGMRAGMILMARSWDMVKIADKNDWAVSAEHPDLDPLQQATQLQQLFAMVHAQDEMTSWQDDFRDWMDQGLEGSTRLMRALTDCSQGGLGEEAWRAEAEVAYEMISQSCSKCHSSYRN